MSATTPVVLTNANDTVVAERTPTTNFANLTYIVCNAGTGNRKYGLIYFARPFPLGATILSATLRLYQIGAESATHTVQLRRLTQGWRLSQATWNYQPADTTTGQVQVTKPGSPAGTEWAFDVTAHMQAVADGAYWSGWKILNTLNDYLNFYSAQATTGKPTLEVVWANQPDAPTTLSPSGNRAVSVAKPVLRWDFTDVAGDTTLAAIQVQINPTNVWTAPAFDSGVVATTLPQLDLATTSYAGLADGASTYWRVRVQDGAGLWSDWSAGHQFQRQTKGTLTIDNPPASGLISEPTPPIIWHFTGRTPAAYQVWVTPYVTAPVFYTPPYTTPDPTADRYASNENSRILYNTGKRAPWTESITLPAGVIQDDSSYTVHVRVWDTIDRESTPGDPPWVEAAQTFLYDYDATVDPVTSLAATDLTPNPGATLTWSRATAPDSFVIRRNGVIIASGVDPADFNTGSTTYAYTDLWADPNKPVTWRVDAVVNGRTSASNPTVTKTLKTKGIWLTDHGRNIQVLLWGDDPGTWAMGEQAETHTPLGASHAIRITQALRGFEGSINARLRPTDTKTLAQQEADLWTLKSTPGRTYTLLLSNVVAQVVIGNLVIAPTDYDDEKHVSFDFWQVAGLPFRAHL
jgi:hypothetical protein